LLCGLIISTQKASISEGTTGCPKKATIQISALIQTTYCIQFQRMKFDMIIPGEKKNPDTFHIQISRIAAGI
jgi:hypothetical protein